MADTSNDRLHRMVLGLSYSELGELISMAEQERGGKLEEARRSLMAEVEQKAASIGLTAEQLFGISRGAPEKQKRGRKAEQPQHRTGTPAAVKFRSPSGQTWSGRGRKPTWLTQAEAAGQSAEEFRVSE